MFIVGGATASGKSRVGALLARRMGGEVVNADPFQIWRGMEVLTAQPGEEERAGVAHHLFGVYPPDYERTAHDFAGEVRACCEEVRSRGNHAVVVSGSGLYLRAVAGGMDDGIPASDADLRRRLEARSLEDLLEELDGLDPVEAGRIDRSNPRRVVRTLEICLLAGRPASELRAKRVTNADSASVPSGIWLDVDADYLKQRIHARARLMFDAGVVEEVAALDGYRIGRSAERTLGLDLVRRVVWGGMSREEAIERLATATWRLARRQRTWFRKAADLVPVAVSANDRAEDVAGRIFERFSAG